MASTPTEALCWIFSQHPIGLPTCSTNEDGGTFQLIKCQLPELKLGQVLVKPLYLSNDPAQRGWIDPTLPAERLYVPPVQLGSTMQARGLGEVVATRDKSLPTGTAVIGWLGWTQYVVLDATACIPVDPLPRGLSLTHYLGALGHPGLTAYYGLVVVGKAQKEMRVVVSGAAGATGSMVVQIAKKIVGCAEVIGIAGTDEKCRWVESLGADICLNYRKPTFETDLIKRTDGFVDLYFDNVGGEILDQMLARLKRNGVVAACGHISAYNSLQPIQFKNFFQIITMRLSIRGFIVADYASKAKETIQLFLRAEREGKLRISDENEQIVPTQMEDIPKTWIKLFAGGNTGKLISKLID